ncbi:MAG: hypothetical protein EOP86_14175 [Verrucomicrobiaceae bacterium]|nr:MAG: hypothetical protein EOP86_14175 [Verrucomicrobiaceae bacterium]
MSARILSYLAGIAWLGAAGAGIASLWHYSLIPAGVHKAGRSWPQASALSKAADGRFSLVMFLHPECPCSRASVEELSVLLARHADRILPQVVFFTPVDKKTEWSDTRLWRQARELPGVRTRMDEAGREAERFGASSSGETFVYDSQGTLVFHGGVTSARGHEGDNDGLAAIGNLVGKSAAETSGTRSPDEGGQDEVKTPVYGCPLHEEREVEKALPEAVLKIGSEQPSGQGGKQ